jgi:hypothetical protein
MKPEITSVESTLFAAVALQISPQAFTLNPRVNLIFLDLLKLGENIDIHTLYLYVICLKGYWL